MYGVNINDEETDMEDNTDEEYMEGVDLEYERGYHWRIFLKDNEGGIYD